MRVTTILNHPWRGLTRLDRKGLSTAGIEALFIDPRAHTNRGIRKYRGIRYTRT